MLEAIPPNFYAYVAGKGSAYLMIEVSCHWQKRVKARTMRG